MPFFKEASFYRKFIISTGLVIFFVQLTIFWGAAFRTRQLINEEKLTQARALFNSIVLTRKWNAHYGGVYVEKKKGVYSNPYLDNPDIKLRDGRTFTNKNPALMTREISEYAEEEGLFKFKITSLKLLNPDNQPDLFETKALLLFDKGEKEVFDNEIINKKTFFRYMAPLHVEQPCLQCHLKQGYKVGDIRGGISIAFDIEDMQKKLGFNTFVIVFFGIGSTLLLLGMLYFFTTRLISRISEAQAEIQRLAITDELTGIFNRRYIMSRFREEFERSKRTRISLSCIWIDIDNFKSVNDKYGHLSGDEVLRVIADRIKTSIRSYDILGRYGGEEFLVVLPDTNFENTKIIAEKIIQKVRAPIYLETYYENLINITASLGIACISDDDTSVDNIVRRADEGLYLAKKSGKDQVGWA